MGLRLGLGLGLGFRLGFGLVPPPGVGLVQVVLELADGVVTRRGAASEGVLGRDQLEHLALLLRVRVRVKGRDRVRVRARVRFG